MSADTPRRPRTLLRTVSALAEAYRYAKDINAPVEEFAVGLEELRAHGASLAALRWLCKKQYAMHLAETTSPGDASRSFSSSSATVFGATSCFALTRSGAQFARSVFTTRSAEKAIAPKSDSVADVARSDKPEWNAQTRELRVRKVLVKKFRQPAAIQEMILSVLEEEGWPEGIDDPLPPKPDVDSRERLHDAIKRLNQHQINRLIHFRGDGTGQRVTWRWWRERQ